MEILDTIVFGANYEVLTSLDCDEPDWDSENESLNELQRN